MRSFTFLILRKQRLLYTAVGMVVLSLVVGVAAYVEVRDERDLAVQPGQPSGPPLGEVVLIVNVTKRTLTVMSDGRPYKQYRIAVGKSKTPTPVGEWKVVWKDYNWGRGFGTRWMGLNVPWGVYGIHGTNKPSSIGRFASGGCIRMRNKDVEELFEWVSVGTPVHIIGPPVSVRRELKVEMAGPDVVIVQQKLRELGFYEGRADGIFGAATETAVKAFQEARNLPVTGKVDKATRKALGFPE